MWEICKFAYPGSMSYATWTAWVAQSPLTAIQRLIWDYCIERNIWISASLLPGCENTEADRESRHFNDRNEWQLIWSAKHWFVCFSLKRAMSSLCLKEAWHRCHVCWCILFYAFSPVSLIGKCLEKLQASGGEGDSGGALLDLPKLVSQIAETTSSSCIDDHSQGNPPDSSRVPETSPIEAKAESVGLSFMRRLYKNRGFSEWATNIVLQSCRQSSKGSQPLN